MPWAWGVTAGARRGEYSRVGCLRGEKPLKTALVGKRREGTVPLLQGGQAWLLPLVEGDEVQKRCRWVGGLGVL